MSCDSDLMLTVGGARTEREMARLARARPAGADMTQE